MENTTTLQQCLQEWPAWALDSELDLQQTPQLIKQFSTGTRNQTYLLRGGHSEFILRIQRSKDNHTLDAVQECQLQNHLAAFHLAPTIFHSVPDARYRVEEYIAGKNLREEDLVCDEKLATLCESIERYHSIDMDALNLDVQPRSYLQDLQRYWLESDEKTQRDSAWRQRYDRALALCQRYELEFGSRRCLTHHDLNPHNIIWRDDSSTAHCVFIDWEFAGLGIPSFDYGALAEEFSIPANRLSEFANVAEDEIALAKDVYRELCAFYKAAV